MCEVRIRWIREGGYFWSVWKSGKLHVQRKTQKFQNIARFEILPLNAGSPCVREKNQNPFPRSNCSKEIAAFNENTRKASEIISQGKCMQKEKRPLGG